MTELAYSTSIQSNYAGKQRNQVGEESTQVQADLVTNYHLRLSNKQEDTRRIPQQATKDTERSDE